MLVDIENSNSISIFDISSILYHDIDIAIEENIAVINKLVMIELIIGTVKFLTGYYPLSIGVTLKANVNTKLIDNCIDIWIKTDLEVSIEIPIYSFLSARKLLK